MDRNATLDVVHGIMTEFAGLTGLSPAGRAPKRYLWTDAFAVCNFLELHRQTGEEKYKDLARQLVDQVHHVLGRHREDDPRSGWISGLGEKEGEERPTAGGLRIGKEMNERGPDDPLDPRQEWDRDGQYYHYLTKWMHALHQTARATGESVYDRWAAELAKAAHAGFTYAPSPGEPKRMYWKMSIDLSRPLVPSMGQHDPLDGFVTYCELQETSHVRPDLSQEIADLARICEGMRWATDDPLGLGGLLSDAYRVAQMIVSRSFHQTELLTALVDDSKRGLDSHARVSSLKLPADYRLAFRELGLSIGLWAFKKLRKLVEDNPEPFDGQRRLHTQIESLSRYTPLIELIEDFWLNPSNRKAATWTEHSEINMVMLATSLAPDGYLEL